MTEVLVLQRKSLIGEVVLVPRVINFLMEIYRAMDDINGAIKGTLDLSRRAVFARVPCSPICVATRLQHDFRGKFLFL